MKKSLIDIFQIKKGDNIFITGAGGKTSLMEKLGSSLKKEGRVLISTSTKIRRPKNKDIDYIYDSFNSYKKIDEKKFLLAMGKLDPKTNKFSSIGEDNLTKISKDFDYMLIEADGCRNLALKMWKSYEPVIYNISSKVICVFSAKVIGRRIDKDFIYNYDDFIKLIDEKIVNKEVFLKLIESKPGPFGDFSSPKFIFFNQVESLEEKEKTLEVIKFLRKNTKNISYAYGSLLREEYYED
ncbi:MAG: selenium cofactor biosynthesis protein YqeC [Peptoniphilaceae bacterium]|nr:selenium cofactor biosynthesis protein YqeC [Peptoniphilaceae bacterium]MDY6018728.1 selenium cofactor biosynthesis protein YqeC [Anaerococcus sp.]